MANETKTYDPKQVSVVIGTRLMTGFAEDDMIEVERDADAFTKHVGTTGEVARSKSNNKCGKITVHLMQTSADNGYLSELMQADEKVNGGIVPIMIRDQNGNDLVVVREGWVQKAPTMSRKREIQSQAWVLDCGPMEKFLGGN